MAETRRSTHRLPQETLDELAYIARRMMLTTGVAHTRTSAIVLAARALAEQLRREETGPVRAGRTRGDRDNEAQV